MQIHAEHDDTLKTSEDFFKKIYLSLYLKVCVCERELETEQNCNILTPHSYGHQRCVFLAFQCCSTGGLGALSAGCCSLYRILSPNSPISKLSDFLSSASYIIVQSPTQYLWNGMFDHHQAEITVMQFTGHSLLVHQSMTVPWDFTLSHIVSQARLHDFFP